MNMLPRRTLSLKKRGTVVPHARRVATKKAVIDWANWEAPKPTNADDWWNAVLAAKEELRLAKIASARARETFVRIKIPKGNYGTAGTLEWEAALSRRSEADAWETHTESLLKKLLGMRNRFMSRKRKPHER